ncbi:MAG: nucleotidyltransferase family protein [Betaproteobacteria bacterium]|nr:nucleotidyltransferase family protein [Betaproteobacteria bacterium]
MILAAGRGERMRPLTDRTPKCLLEAGGKPLIQWHVEALQAAGFADIAINHAWLGGQIESYLGDGSRFGVRIRYSSEGTALETAGGIAKALPLLEGECFVVVNGDIFTDFDFAALLPRAAMLASHAKNAHLVLVNNPAHNAKGDFSLEGKRVTFASSPPYTFSGIGVYKRSFFAYIVPGTRAALGPLLKQAISQGDISGCKYDGLWLDVGTPERLAQADQLARDRLS